MRSAAMNELPAFKITYHDGSDYVTSMARGVTLEDARDYFLGQTFVTDEDENTGKETKRRAVKVEVAK